MSDATGAVFVDLDRTLIRSASGPVFQEAMVDAGVLSPGRKLPGDRYLYGFYNSFGETVPFMGLARAAARLTDAGQLVAVARGYLLAAARETALKLRETSGILAEGWSAADLRHGPVAAIGAHVPVLSLRAAGPAAGGPTCCASTTAPTPTFPCLPVCLNRWPTSAPSCAASTWPAWSRSGAASTRTNRWGSIRSPRAEGGLYGTQLHPGPRAKT